MTAPFDHGEVHVSVVVPVGAVDDLLEQQLDALTCLIGAPPHELILANNVAGTEADVRLARLVEPVRARSGAAITIIPADGRRNIAHARNAGVRHARANLLAFCDADDRVHPDWLARIVAGLDGDDAVGGRLIDTSLDGRPPRRPAATPDSLPTYMGVPYAVGANLAVTRGAFERAGGFDESLHRCEDIAFSWRLLELGCTIGWAGDACIDYHHRSGLAALARQHLDYGRGMAQVLARYDPPGRETPSGPFQRAFHPNSPLGADLTPTGIIRRGALATGRLIGTIGEHTGRRSVLRGRE